MFLGKRRENKVGMRYGKELTLRLTPLRGSLAEDASLPHGHKRLYQLVTFALRIGFRLDKRG
jgi:hypothetical protein